MLREDAKIIKVYGWMYLLREGDVMGEGEWVQWQASPRHDVAGTKPLTGDEDDIQEIINEALSLLDTTDGSSMS